MARYILDETNGNDLVAKIKSALGTNPKVSLKEYRHFLSEERTPSKDKIKGVILQKCSILITLEKSGRREINVGDDFLLYNDNKMGKRLVLGSGWTIIQV